MKKITKRILSVLLGVGLMVGAVGCGNSGQKQGDNKSSTATIDEIKSRGELRVATATGYPPYIFTDINSPNQDLTGIDAAMAKAIADELGVKLKWTNTNFEGMLSALGSGSVDFIIGGVSPTDERKKTMDFSDNYVEAEQKLIVRKEDKDKYKTLNDLAGKKVAAQKSTTQETLAKDKISGAEIVALAKVPDCILELKTGKVDAVVVESSVASPYVLAYPEITFSDISLDKELKPTAIPTQKGKEDLVALINKVIKENKDNGNIDKWFKEYSELASSYLK